LIKHNHQELYDEFYDYVGQDLFDRIKYGQEILKEELEEWGCQTTDSFLKSWRDNSDNEFQKWLNEKGKNKYERNTKL